MLHEPQTIINIELTTNLTIDANQMDTKNNVVGTNAIVVSPVSYSFTTTQRKTRDVVYQLRSFITALKLFF